MNVRTVGFAEYRRMAIEYAQAIRSGRTPRWAPAPADKVHSLGIFGVQAGVGLKYGG